jgi:hypothetical protein
MLRLVDGKHYDRWVIVVENGAIISEENVAKNNCAIRF